MDFKKLTRLLIPLIVEGVLTVRRNSQHRLIEKLHELEFCTRKIEKTETGITIELQILDVDLLYQLLAGEANKFLLASRLSLDRSTQPQAKNASWQTIEHYYAAYYAAHYLIRLTGISLTNLDSNATKAVTRNFCEFSQATVPNGLYLLSYDVPTQTLTLRKNLKKSSGGSHQDAWQLWVKLVEKLSAETSSDPVEYAATSVELSEHKKFLLKSSGKFNPPEIRGEINYQFKGGAWIFEENAEDSIRRQQQAIIDPQSQAAINLSSPEGLIFNNKIIIGLAKAVFTHSSHNYPRSICRSLANKYANYVA